MTGAAADARPMAMADDLIRLPVSDVWAAHALADRLRREPLWLDAVPGLTEVVGRFDPDQISLAAALQAAQAAMDAPPTRHGDGPGAGSGAGTVMVLPVRYGGEEGPDLDAVCQAAGLSRDALIERHTATVFTVELMGFTPGFAYCGGLDPTLSVPRLKRPRIRVAAGSVGLGAAQTGLYALAGPGGWPLIGRTTAVLFDPASTAPFLLSPGQRLRFEPA